MPPTDPLRDGSTTGDPRLGRIPQPDERNRAFPIRALVGYPTLQAKVWRLPERLDQGQEGSCVGHGFAHELAAYPVRVKGVTHQTAVGIYRRAQQLDDWPGEEPAYSGTSVLAGAKAVQELGHLDEYRWALTAQDVAATLSAFGPVVIGVDWHRGMMDTDARGYVTPTGEVVGGHCVCLRGLVREASRWVAVGRNSWGPSWGVGGDFKLAIDDLQTLMGRGGDACVPVVRR
jgi:hypothetical protein